MRSQPLEMFRGDAAGWRFPVTLDGAAVDVTGASVRFTAKRLPTDADGSAVITRTVGSGVTLTDPTNGVITVVLDPDDTDALEVPVTLLWDLQVTSGGLPRTVAHGTLAIAADISRTVP